MIDRAVAHINTHLKLFEIVLAILLGRTRKAHRRSAQNIFIVTAIKRAKYMRYPISKSCVDIHWLLDISGESMTRNSFFPKNNQRIAPIRSIPARRAISRYSINKIFQNKKLKISSCIFPIIPTQKIPHASPICAIISLLDSLAVRENFSIKMSNNTHKSANSIPNT